MRPTTLTGCEPLPRRRPAIAAGRGWLEAERVGYQRSTTADAVAAWVKDASRRPAPGSPRATDRLKKTEPEAEAEWRLRSRGSAWSGGSSPTDLSCGRG